MPDKDTIRLITQSNDALRNELRQEVNTQKINFGNFIMYYDADSDSVKVDYIEG